MAILKIVLAPSPVLKKKAEPVLKVDQDVQKIMNDMLETMYENKGCGLAAPQVNISKRILVLDVSDNKEEPIQMANPIILECSQAQNTHKEGCLSFPDQFFDVDRPANIVVQYLDYNNETKVLKATGLLATCIQHEIDHLDGKLFIDGFSKAKQQIILERVSKAKPLVTPSKTKVPSR